MPRTVPQVVIASEAKQSIPPLAERWIASSLAPRNDGAAMALIGRLFVILLAFLFACLAAGIIVVGAVLYPEFSDLATGQIDQNAINIVLGFGFIFISRLCAVAGVDRGVDHRGVLHPKRARLCGRRRGWSAPPAISG